MGRVLPQVAAVAAAAALLAVATATTEPVADTAFARVDGRGLVFGDAASDDAPTLFELGRDEGSGSGGQLLLRAGDGSVALAVEESGGGVRADKLRSGGVTDVGGAVEALQQRVSCLTDVVSFQAAGGVITNLPPALCTCLHGEAAGDRCSFVASCADADNADGGSAAAAEYWIVPGGDTAASRRSTCASGDEWADDTVATFAATKFLLQSSTLAAAAAPASVAVWVPGDASAAMAVNPSGGAAIVKDGTAGAFPSSLVSLAAGATLVQAHASHFDVDAGDFTLDLFARRANDPDGGTAQLVSLGMDAYASSSYPSCVYTVSGVSVAVAPDGSATLRMSHHSGTGTEAAVVCTTAANAAGAPGTWVHFAAQRVGGTAALYINGERACGKDSLSDGWDVTLHGLQSPIALGRGYGGNAPGTCTIRQATSEVAVDYDMVRLTAGVARWPKEGFEAPTREPRV